jgi:hypothetical protein
MKLTSALIGILFSIVWLVVLAWVVPNLAEAAIHGELFRVGVCFLVAIVSAYWLFVGFVWTFEDLTGKNFGVLKPRWLR